MNEDREIIFIISPLSGKNDEEISRNIDEARKICSEYVAKGYNPFAPHLYYPHFLTESKEEERRMGIELGMQIMKYCTQVHVFMSIRGITKGMQQEINEANKLNKPITYI